MSDGFLLVVRDKSEKTLYQLGVSFGAGFPVKASRKKLLNGLLLLISLLSLGSRRVADARWAGIRMLSADFLGLSCSFPAILSDSETGFSAQPQFQAKN
jgi:hypothetical protein